MGGLMSDHVPSPNPLQATDDRRAAAAPDGPVPGRPDLRQAVVPPAGPDPGPTPPPSGPKEPPDPGADPPPDEDGCQERPRLQSPRRGRRLVAKPASPPPALTPQQRLLLLDTWQRSGLPAGDFAALV